MRDTRRSLILVASCAALVLTQAWVSADGRGKDERHPGHRATVVRGQGVLHSTYQGQMVPPGRTRYGQPISRGRGFTPPGQTQFGVSTPRWDDPPFRTESTYCPTTRSSIDLPYVTTYSDGWVGRVPRYNQPHAALPSQYPSTWTNPNACGLPGDAYGHQTGTVRRIPRATSVAPTDYGYPEGRVLRGPPDGTWAPYVLPGR